MKSEGVDGSVTLSGVVFIDLPLTITILRVLSALKYIPAHDKAFTYLCKRFCAPETDEDIRFKSSINAKGKATLPVHTNLRADEAKVYPITTFIPGRKRIIDKVHPAKIPLKC